MASNPIRPRKLTPIWRAMVEIGFIVFLLYSSLLMREFTHASGRGKNLALAFQDIFTVTNFAIAIISGLLGYLVLECIRIQR
jgi:hypothetical protein